MFTTTPNLDDLHPNIIQTHILPRLDGPSLSATSAASSYLKTLCSDDTLWHQISQTTWPSLTHPRVADVISTFPFGYRCFFNDVFPTFITNVDPCNTRRFRSTPKSGRMCCNLDRSFRHTWPNELISAVDIRYKNELIYSNVNFTQITSEFLSSAFCIFIDNESQKISRTIDLTVDEVAGADKPTLLHLKESLTLNWILIDPTRKRACNLSSIKPIVSRQDWVTNETVLRYVTVLPGCESNEIVKCKIQVVLDVCEKGVGLYVKEVMVKLEGLDRVSLKGVEFMVVAEKTLMSENKVRRSVVSDEERLKSYMLFKAIKRDKKVIEKRAESEKKIWQAMDSACFMNGNGKLSKDGGNAEPYVYNGRKSFGSASQGNVKPFPVSRKGRTSRGFKIHIPIPTHFSKRKGKTLSVSSKRPYPNRDHTNEWRSWCFRQPVEPYEPPTYQISDYLAEMKRQFPEIVLADKVEDVVPIKTLVSLPPVNYCFSVLLGLVSSLAALVVSWVSAVALRAIAAFVGFIVS
ncbi:hypothetical protein QVD17_15709 [Tagetes erecta]|uniref:F-box protein n=1 Tax=Tagetes erecta TaxID=13708 RepID=A0AAD8KQ52_TARER|nr:hypothetical protein QVD17_15709 [Tagetes erecta]